MRRYPYMHWWSISMLISIRKTRIGNVNTDSVSSVVITYILYIFCIYIYISWVLVGHFLIIQYGRYSNEMVSLWYHWDFQLLVWVSVRLTQMSCYSGTSNLMSTVRLFTIPQCIYVVRLFQWLKLTKWCFK